ncbi:sodium/hydrogen exchanger 10-like isoform X2 [Aethina tumida]|uniref:sodium/hydrogen exchanger 10-like isoform X2 n=1 Tax=Aethina tumida TaxID=116153 RepID=UPI002148D70E|nr:sodium/hydrogen exchanger 10-like isoform X2 [Aethina tumida]
MKHLVTYQTLRAPYPILAERLSLDIIYFSKVLNALRRIICLNCGSPLRAFLQKHSKLICTKRTQAAFELGKAYITVEQELLDILHNIVNNQELLMEIFTEIQENVIDIMMCLSYITKLRDWISTTAESKSAMIKIITAMYMSGQELRDAGWLSVKEFKKMSDLLTLKISKIQSIKHIDRPTPKEMFYEIVWLMDEEPEIVEYLLSNTQSLVFQPGEVLVRVNNYIPGIYIVTSGLFIETFVPDKLILNRMDTKGELPIMDNINLYTLESPNKIFNSVGAVIGELGVLTGRKYSTNIIAKTYSTVLFIQKLHIEEAFARSNDPIHGLKAKMWKNIMFRMAKFILSLEPVYQYVSKIMLSLTLSNHAFLPEISFFKTFCFDQKVQDAILCEGQCMNVDSKDHYIAPCYIPRGIQTVSFVRSHDGLNHAKLLLLLKKGSDEYEFMSKTFMSSDVDPQAKNVFVKYVGTSQKKKKHLLNVEKKTQQADIRVKAFKVERSGTGSVRDSSISTISLSKSQYSTASGKYRGSEQPSERTDRSEKTERAERAERKASSPNF